MYSKLIVLTVLALSVVVPSMAMDDLAIKRHLGCCPVLTTGIKAKDPKECVKKGPCKMQCIFESMTTTTNNITLVDLAAVKTAIGALTTFDPAVITAVQTNCTSTAPTGLKGQCKSGVREVYSCALKALTANCPTPVPAKCGGLIPKAKLAAAKSAAAAPAAAAAPTPAPTTG